MSEPSLSNPEPSPFEKMTALATRVMAVPKLEVDRREEEWKENRKKASDKKKRAA